MMPGPALWAAVVCAPPSSVRTYARMSGVSGTLSLMALNVPDTPDIRAYVRTLDGGAQTTAAQSAGPGIMRQVAQVSRSGRRWNRQVTASRRLTSPVSYTHL